MTSQTLSPKASQYIDRVNDLYNDIKKWIRKIDPQANFNELGELTLNEEGIGQYKAPTLVIQRDNPNHNIRLSPRGCNILAAAGRVEIATALGRESLVYLEGQPSVQSTITEGVGTSHERIGRSSTRPLINAKYVGWGWIQDKKSGNVPQLGEDVFEELLREIS